MGWGEVGGGGRRVGRVRDEDDVRNGDELDLIVSQLVNLVVEVVEDTLELCLERVRNERET